ncbi:biotin synthase [Jimgerdemannia flammicorona]|uniref:Biotin synthase n=1 Tax=Jimgerdemannia flammicorona TaxID=994334 RepID=A0A433QJ33_9FUNG|nr:biotin synthase [Jimgerdemannia flammicorona]
MSAPRAFRLLSHPLRSSRRLYTTSTTPLRFASVDEKLSPTVAKVAATVAARGGLSPAAVHAEGPLRNDWLREEIQGIYDSPLMDLLYFGAKVHRANFNPLEVQQCTLLSIKTGGCSEDCKYCPQSSHHKTAVKAQKMLDSGEVMEAARRAKEAGSTRCVLGEGDANCGGRGCLSCFTVLAIVLINYRRRFCMGAAWRDLAGRKSNFNKILGYVTEIRGMGMEVCCTLGMLNEEQAKQLKTAGLTAYNHNLDTSREFYPKVITTRSYDERLETISHAQHAGISVCSGGIIGLGEKDEDRVGLLHTLSTLSVHPESVPVNALLAVDGTPLEKQEPVSIFEMVRMIATARIVMPRSMVRLSAGRVRFLQSEQAMCFLAGANSIFTGDRLLTTPNNEIDDDRKMFEVLGLIPKPPNFEQGSDNPRQAEYVAAANVKTDGELAHA